VSGGYEATGDGIWNWLPSQDQVNRLNEDGGRRSLVLGRQLTLSQNQELSRQDYAVATVLSAGRPALDFCLRECPAEHVRIARLSANTTRWSECYLYACHPQFVNGYRTII
jgi:hypothetical protein